MKVTSAILFIIILISSCSENKVEQTKSIRAVWPSDIEKLNLKGDIYSVTEYKLYKGDSVQFVDVYSFDKSGMILEKLSISNNGEPAIIKFNYDNSKRLITQSANGSIDSLKYSTDSMVIKYLNNNNIYRISTYSKDGQLILDRRLIGGDIFDSCVYFYEDQKLIKTLTYLENELKVKQEFKYDKNRDLIEESWLQGDDVKNISLKKYSYSYDQFNNWIGKTVTINSDTFYTVKRDIKYKNSH